MENPWRISMKLATGMIVLTGYTGGPKILQLVSWMDQDDAAKLIPTYNTTRRKGKKNIT